MHKAFVDEEGQRQRERYERMDCTSLRCKHWTGSLYTNAQMIFFFFFAPKNVATEIFLFNFLKKKFKICEKLLQQKNIEITNNSDGAT